MSLYHFPASWQLCIHVFEMIPVNYKWEYVKCLSLVLIENEVNLPVYLILSLILITVFRVVTSRWRFYCVDDGGFQWALYKNALPADFLHAWYTFLMLKFSCGLLLFASSSWYWLFKMSYLSLPCNPWFAHMSGPYTCTSSDKAVNISLSGRVPELCCQFIIVVPWNAPPTSWSKFAHVCVAECSIKYR